MRVCTSFLTLAMVVAVTGFATSAPPIPVALAPISEEDEAARSQTVVSPTEL